MHISFFIAMTYLSLRVSVLIISVTYLPDLPTLTEEIFVILCMHLDYSSTEIGPISFQIKEFMIQ